MKGALTRANNIEILEFLEKSATKVGVRGKMNGPRWSERKTSTLKYNFNIIIPNSKKINYKMDISIVDPVIKSKNEKIKF